MDAPHIQLVSRGRRVPFFRDPIALSSVEHPWAGYSFEEASSPPDPLPLHAWSKTTLLHITGGQGSLSWQHRGVWNKDSCRQGTVSIVRRDVEIQSAVPSGPFPMMVLQLDNRKLQHIAPDHVATIEKSLVPVQVTSDYRLATLMSAMMEEVREGCYSGRLYGEAISLSLLAYLAGSYATRRQEDGRVRKLSGEQMRTVADYVQTNLGGDIGVTDLAGLVQISPSHFSRIFKASFGVTPYQFVMRQRIEEAKRLLVDVKVTSSQIGMMMGFASQSHFVKVFRRFTGVSPKQYRAGF